MGEPQNRREARRWLNLYWAQIIAHADMGGVADMQNDFLDDVWGDQCRKIAQRLRDSAGEKP